MIAIVMGLPGSDKSFFAARIVQMLNAKYISSVGVRKEMFATPIYSSESKALVYNEMLRRTIETAKHGKEVVVDATFYMNNLRKKFAGEVWKLADVFWIEVIADENLVHEIVTQRRAGSDASFDVYQL